MHLTRKYTLSILLSITMSITLAQVVINYEVNTRQIIDTISPYIYGANTADYPLATFRRQGGNRLTGYNWENNFSHAGEDYFNYNDNYLPWIMALPQDDYDVPGIVNTAFHDDNLSKNALSLITLPMAGYVSADGNQEVFENETAPSGRWVEVQNRKQAPFSLSPDLNDGKVYVDEQLNFLIDRYGNAATQNGIHAYSLDNEPALWCSTHPRITPACATVTRFMDQSFELAATVKDMDEMAKVFGPTLYGFAAYTTFQDASDWGNYSATYEWFIDAYLDLMRQESEQRGERLLDVLDVHWYPEPSGVFNGDTSQQVAETRMQLPRSLWDSTYVEDGWIGTWFSPVAIIHALNASIDRNYPGTQLGITEYDYGAPEHISGGIAQVEALGVFGKLGVDYATKWNPVTAYIKQGFDMFRNYDGQEGQFGNIALATSNEDIDQSSIYAAYSENNPEELHLILVNKDYNDAILANVVVHSPYNFASSDIWSMNRGVSTLTQSQPIAITNNILSYTLPPLSVYHFVLTTEPNTLPGVLEPTASVDVYPVPAEEEIHVTINQFNEPVSYDILDYKGMQIKEGVLDKVSNTIDLPKGESSIYLLRVYLEDEVVIKKVVLDK